MSTSSRGRSYLLIVIVALLVGAGVVAAVTALAASNLQNLGFEQGAQGLDGWSVPQPVGDFVGAVGPEGPDQYPVYRSKGITVAPREGRKMLRLGTPTGASQRKGKNQVSQTFTSVDTSLSLSFRLFSWEFRGGDTLTIDLEDVKCRSKSYGTLEQPLTITMTNGKKKTFTKLPIQIKMDSSPPAGRLLDTGWRVLNVRGIPVGKSMTLTYALSVPNNTGHGTWAYFDYGNTPPVAEFEWDDTMPFEGLDQIVFGDLSSDPDAGDSIASYDWHITGPGGFTDEFDGENSYFIPPNQGRYGVTLTVTDQHGATGSASTTVTVDNSWAPANALNTQFVPGRPTSLMARFLDPGWEDTHAQASWDVGGMHIAGSVEDHLETLSSGIATAPVTLDASADGVFTITDNDGASFTDSMTVEAVQPSELPESYEPNNAFDQAPALTSDWVRLSQLQSSGDVDVYEVLMPDGSPLPIGTEVLASLKELPADYDLVVVTKPVQQQAGDAMQAAPFQENTADGSGVDQSAATNDVGPFASSGGVSSSGARHIGARHIGARHIGARHIGARHIGARHIGARHIGARHIGPIFGVNNIDGFPLSEMAFTGLDGNNSGATDIALSELGIPVPEGETYRVAGFSANKGTSDEAVLASTEASGTRVFVAVVGAGGAFSDQPYALQLETAQGDFDASYDPANYAPFVPESSATSQPVTLATPAAQLPQTLFVTQAQRYAVLYGQAEWNGLAASLSAFVQRADILGKVVSVPSTIYDAWDSDPRNVDAANQVASDVRTIVRDELKNNPTIKYVVFVGTDRIVPHYRVPDQTVIGNERLYADNSFLFGDTPMYASLWSKRILTDDFYTDAEPIPWQGRQLFIPDVATSRLVETPAEVTRQLAVYADTGGQLEPATAMVTGFDFFNDAATATADTFDAAGLTTDRSLVGWDWKAADLRAKLLTSPKSVSNPNSHYLHYAALSAWGFNNNSFTDLLFSQDVANAGTAANALTGKLVFTIGCHAGMSVADSDTASPDPLLGLQPALDFPQAMARQGAVFVGNTGHGLGDDTTIGFSERLTQIYAADLLGNMGTTVGDALVATKQQYLMGLGAMTVYDEKSAIEMVLYGLPQFRVKTDAGALSALSAVSGSAHATGFSLLQSLGLMPSDFTLSVTDGASTVTTVAPLTRVDTTDGSYYRAGTTSTGGVEDTAFRPLQPKVEWPISHSAVGEVHGVLVTGGAFAEESLFNPVFGRPTYEWEIDPGQIDTSPDGWWPSWLPVLKTLASNETTIQNVVVRAGQFRDESTGTVVSGTERLYSSLAVDLLRSSDVTDWEAPWVGGVTIYSVDATHVSLVLSAADASGISRIEVLQTAADGTISGTSSMPSNPNAGQFVVQVPVPAGVDLTELSFTIQVADGNGNIAVNTAKGATLRFLSIDAGPDMSLAFGVPTTFTATIADYALSPQPVGYRWDFTGTIGASEYSESVTGMVEDALVSVNETNGAGTFSVQHTFNLPDGAPDPLPDLSIGATLTVTDGFGGIGSDSKQLIYDITPPEPSNVVWVDPAGSDAEGDGSDLNPYLTIQFAMDTIRSNFPTGTVMANPGTYTEALQMRNGITLYGVGGPSETIVAGDVGPAVGAYSAGEPSRIQDFGLTRAPETTGWAVAVNGMPLEIDNCRVFGGLAAIFSGGLNLLSGETTVTNTTIQNNTGDTGGGLYVAAGARPYIDNCTIINNHATANGGGVAIFGSVELRRSTIWLNTADIHGGGLWMESVDASTSVLDDNRVIGGHAEGVGGGAVFWNCDNVDVQAGYFAGNSCRLDGGGVFVNGPGELRLWDCIFDSNTGEQTGGGIAAQGGAHIGLSGCTVSANYSQSGGGISAYGGSTPYITASVVRNNTATAGSGGGMVLGGAHPAMVQDTDFLDNTTSFDGGGIYSLDSTLSVIGGTFARNQAHYGGALALESGGEAQVENVVFDRNRAAPGGATFTPGRGGAIYLFAGTPLLKVVGDTFGENYAGIDGAGQAIYIFSGYVLGMNTVIYQSVPFGPQTAPIFPSAGWHDFASCQVTDADPGFIDAANSNYLPLETSPLLGAGVTQNTFTGIPSPFPENLTIVGMTYDHDGVTRPRPAEHRCLRVRRAVDAGTACICRVASPVGATCTSGAVGSAVLPDSGLEGSRGPNGDEAVSSTEDVATEAVRSRERSRGNGLRARNGVGLQRGAPPLSHVLRCPMSPAH